MSPAERLQVLRDNYDKVENTSYMRALSEDDLAAKHSQLADNAIALNRMEMRKKSLAAQLKTEADPLKQQNKTLLEQIETRAEKVDGVLYSIADHTDGMMYIYDGDGNFHSSRRLRPEERQGKLIPMTNTGS